MLLSLENNYCIGIY